MCQPGGYQRGRKKAHKEETIIETGKMWNQWDMLQQPIKKSFWKNHLKELYIVLPTREQKIQPMAENKIKY